MQTQFGSEERLTQAQFFDWIQKEGASLLGHRELIDGRVVVTPPAPYEHSGIAAYLVMVLGSHVLRHKMGRVFESSAGYELPSGDTLQPDVSFLSHARIAAGPAPDPLRFIRCVPDLVVEVLSPSTSRRDRTVKKDLYARNGVDEYWLVDCRRTAVMVMHRSGQAFASVETFYEGMVRSRILPDLELSVEDMFQHAR